MDRKNLIEKLVSQKLASQTNRKAGCVPCFGGKPAAQQPAKKK